MCTNVGDVITCHIMIQTIHMERNGDEDYYQRRAGPTSLCLQLGCEI